ncbi:MAG: flap endonuclease [Actinobacteria bacterium ATB1]|nr:flap endonuclease [Actinobacteria bacterium ATB1]
MQVHLVDGTYELFRHHFARVPRHTDISGADRTAVRGVISSCLGLLERGATHVGVATDHVIESFRNDLYEGYKTGDGIDPVLLAQFGPLEDALETLGLTVWAMVDLEADDALASAARVAETDPTVDRVYVCTPDKDLAQCVRGNRVVQCDARGGTVRDEAGVIEKFGVGPDSIPDYLALVGDSADGFPGIPGWGAKSAATALARYGKLDGIPRNASEWDVAIRGASRLAASLAAHEAEAALFRHLATLRTDADVGRRAGDWLWRGPEESFESLCEELRTPGLWERSRAIAEGRNRR